MATPPQDLDDRTAAYALAAVAPFDALRLLATQLAGFMLMKTVDARERHIQDTPLQRFDERLGEAIDALAALQPPAAGAHHHHHLQAAAAHLQRARGLIDRTLILSSSNALANQSEAALNAAIAHLRHASRSLPGFEMVDLSGACCAFHGQPADAAVSR